MSRAANGTYTAPTNSWNSAVEGTTIDESDWNETLADVVNALTDSVSRTGKGTVSAHIDFDENASPGTPASNVGRLYAADVGGATSLMFKDASGNTYNLLLASPGLAFSFDTSTDTASDPGNGDIRFNSSTYSAVTEIATDDLDGIGNNVETFLQALEANSYLFFAKRSGAGIAIFQLVSVSNESGFTKITVTYVDHHGTFAAGDPISLTVGPAGPEGPMGDGDVDGPASSTDNALVRFDGTTGKLLQNSGTTLSDAGSLNLPASQSVSFNSVAILSDSSGTTTLANIDALDATTEATIESAIDTLPNLTVTATGGSSARALAAHFADVLNVMDFGAAGDGATNDATAWTNALAAGRPIDGGGRTFGVNGNVTLPSGTIIRNAVFKQLTPSAAGDVRTLTTSSASNIVLENVKVDRNGDGTNGALNDDAGIYISGGTNIALRGVEVYGDDLGTGITITGAAQVTVHRAYVHDLDYSLGADPGDDRVQGIWINACTDVHVSDCNVSTLGGNFGGGATTQYSRGFAFTGNSRISVVGCSVDNVDQGFDWSGSSGNQNFTQSACTAYQARSWGFKFANANRDGVVTGCVARRIGYAGFNVTDTNQASRTQNISFINCDVYEAGYNGVYAASTPSPTGFLTAEHTTYPRNIMFMACRAIDQTGSPTMVNGFTFSGSAAPPSVYAYGCRVIGHTGSEYTGGIVALGHVTATGLLEYATTADAGFGITFDNNSAGSSATSRLNLRTGTVDAFVLTDNGALKIGTDSAHNVTFFRGGTDELTLTATSLSPTTSDGSALGTSSLMWGDLFLASGGVVNFDNGNYTLAHSAGNLTAAGGPFTAPSLIPSSSTLPTNGLYLPAANTLGWAINSAAEMQLTASALSPAVSDGNALGTTSLMWSDLFLASGGVINFNNGNVAVTHSAGHISISPANLVVNNAANVSAAFNATDNNSSGSITLTSRTSGGTVIDGRLLTDNGGAVEFGSFSNHNVNIRTNSTQVATVDTSGNFTNTGSTTAKRATAIPAGGTAAVLFSSTANFGLFFGSGSPNGILSAAKGSQYLRSDGSGTNDRAYINTDGSTAWTAVVTVA